MRYGVCTTMDRYGDLCALGYDYIELPGTAVRRMTAAQTAEAARRLKGEGRPCIGFNAYCGADLPIVGEGYRAPPGPGVCRRATTGPGRTTSAGSF